MIVFLCFASSASGSIDTSFENIENRVPVLTPGQSGFENLIKFEKVKMNARIAILITGIFWNGQKLILGLK